MSMPILLLTPKSITSSCSTSFFSSCLSSTLLTRSSRTRLPLANSSSPYHSSLLPDSQIISASLIRIPEYRICFLTQLQSTIKNTGVEPDAGVETIAFSTTTSTFIDKYIDPSLLRSAAPLNLPTSSSRLSGLLSDSLRVSLPRTTPLSGISAETGSADERPAGEAGEGESLAGVEEDFPSFVSEAIEEQSIDFKSRNVETG